MFSYRLRTSLSNTSKSFLKDSKQSAEKFNTPLSTGISQYNNLKKFDLNFDYKQNQHDVNIDFSTTNLLPLGNVPFASSLESSSRSLLTNVNKSSMSTLSNNPSTSFMISSPMNPQPLNVFSQNNLSRRNYSSLVDPSRNELPEGVQQLVEKKATKGYLDWDEKGNMKALDGSAANYDKRQFTYFVVSAGRFIGAAAVRLAVLRILFSWGASADTLALATIEVDIANIPRGKTITVIWQGKPVFVRHRTLEEVEEQKKVPISELRDPQTDDERFKNTNWTIVLAVCTHLGCVPVIDAGSYNAFFCPCHGSHYDVSGRIRKGPAPLNLEIPKHIITDDEALLTLG